MNPRHCVIMAGGTGGHVFPGLAVARVLEQRGWSVSWLGTESGLEARLVPDAGLTLDTLTVQSLRGGGLMRWLMLPFRLSRAVLQARRVLKSRRPAGLRARHGRLCQWPRRAGGPHLGSAAGDP